ncbi:MAG: ThuA domain-containing protein, partial [Verrucomicrobiales bacterium]|nr:ThuA domain-containing protein [Verrucomicrobiales bacterium]
MMNKFLKSTAMAALLAVPTGSLSAADPVKTEFPPVRDEYKPKIDAAIPEKLTARPKAGRKILVFSRTEGFAHDTIPDGIYLMDKLAEKTGAFSVEHSGDMEVFTPAKLREFDAIFFN